MGRTPYFTVNTGYSNSQEVCCRTYILEHHYILCNSSPGEPCAPQLQHPWSYEDQVMSQVKGFSVPYVIHISARQNYLLKQEVQSNRQRWSQEEKKK